MKRILDVGKDIFNEIKNTGNHKLLLDLFFTRTKVWKHYIIHDEFGSYGIFDDITELDSKLAFELISTSVEIVVNQSDEILFTTALSLLLTSVEQSNTTEIPNDLLKNWTYISNKVSEFSIKDSSEIWDKISKWYRIDR
jgi:hypothetical protein